MWSFFPKFHPLFVLLWAGENIDCKPWFWSTSMFKAHSNCKILSLVISINWISSRPFWIPNISYLIFSSEPQRHHFWFSRLYGGPQCIGSNISGGASGASSSSPHRWYILLSWQQRIRDKDVESITKACNMYAAIAHRISVCSVLNVKIPYGRQDYIQSYFRKKD